MRWWFDASNHQVKIVILAKLDQRRDRIILQRWEEELPIARPGATATRASTTASLEPKLQQEIIITRDTTTNPATYHVVSNVLVLKFELLFLRTPGPGEGDIMLSISDLQGYAERVWEDV